jgi:hypothetical protein
MPDDGLTALHLLLAAVDQRETEHYVLVTGGMTDIRRALNSIRTESHMNSEQTELLRQQLADQDARIRIMAGHHHDENGEVYTPVSNIEWHKLTEEALAVEVARLQGWVSKILRPGYGLMAIRLLECWPKHLFCCRQLDWLSELYSYLYLNEKRSGAVLVGQAEFTTRHLPNAINQMAEETKDCSPHSETRTLARQRQSQLRRAAPPGDPGTP